MRARDAALIRKLCSLGLPAQTLAQSLLPALRQIVPAHSGGVFWVDANGEMVGLYAERLLSPELMAGYHESHYRDAGAGFASAFRKRAAREDPVSSHSFSKQEQATAYFRDVLRCLDAYHVLYGVLRNRSGPFAQISLYRGASDAAFGKSDEVSLRDLLSYLSRGLDDLHIASPDHDGAIVVEESLGVITPQGEVVAATEDWLRLVRLAALQRVSPGLARAEPAAVAEFLRGACESATTSTPRNSSSTVVRHTPWGRFSMRVYQLSVASSEPDRLGVLIRREEPRALAIVRGAGRSGLSPQQREVAVLLANAKTDTEIASRLNLTANTAHYHVKQVMARLGVNKREDVYMHLIGLSHAMV